ncbi:RidA family protein [Xanthobacter dioxanivorans]|uniref:RidA family protein n=1 Tax=Xanthobacter dioxanivorans TaxID=2528964 RepID=UPI001E59179D|nr:RidA family protein [Xanthobacter dioxanivorans]
MFTSGMTPRRDGKLVASGQVSSRHPPDFYRDMVELACANALAAARSVIQDPERIAAVLSLTVFIAAADDFEAHSRIADFASAYLHRELGQAGIGSRAAIGVATLPGNACVEIQLVAVVEK